MSTLKEGEHECHYCHMHVNGKDLMLHMAFHIGRGEAVGVCLPCLFCGHTDGTCRLHMNKVCCADAQWQIAPTSCAHHCFRKVNMASLRKQLVHNEPLLCVVPGCGRWESRYNMPAHLEVDDTHKDFIFTAEQNAKREVGEEEKAVLQLGFTTWQKQLSKEKSAKDKKRVHEKRHKLKGEVALQREILAKAAARKDKKASRRKQKKAARRAAREGDQEAEAAMEVQDQRGADYQPHSSSNSQSDSDSNSDSGISGKSSDISSTSGSSSNRSSSSGSNSSRKAAKREGLAKKGKKRATSSSSSNSSSGSDKKPAKRKPAGKQGKKRAATSQGGKAKKQ